MSATQVISGISRATKAGIAAATVIAVLFAGLVLAAPGSAVSVKGKGYGIGPGVSAHRVTHSVAHKAHKVHKTHRGLGIGPGVSAHRVVHHAPAKHHKH